MKNLLLLFTVIMISKAAAQPINEGMKVHYKKINTGGINIFYREAGPVDAPVILLMHGFPSSSFMFRNLSKN
ncbi:MAG: hypothetical protein QM791_17040 [Ferruginibacter sp.]